jgi:hypothetical protein
MLHYSVLNQHKEDLMHKTKSAVTGFLFLLVVALTGIEAAASGYSVASDDFRVSISSAICVVEVSAVAVRENKRFFMPASVRKLSTTYKVEGTVLESLKGDCGEGFIISEYTTPVGVQYDAFGEAISYARIITFKSGLESDVSVGKRYILSFMSFDASAKRNSHVRVDALSAYEETAALIEQANQ